MPEKRRGEGMLDLNRAQDTYDSSDGQIDSVSDGVGEDLSKIPSIRSA